MIEFHGKYYFKSRQQGEREKLGNDLAKVYKQENSIYMIRANRNAHRGNQMST